MNNTPHNLQVQSKTFLVNVLSAKMVRSIVSLESFCFLAGWLEGWRWVWRSMSMGVFVSGSIHLQTSDHFTPRVGMHNSHAFDDFHALLALQNKMLCKTRCLNQVNPGQH